VVPHATRAALALGLLAAGVLAAGCSASRDGERGAAPPASGGERIGQPVRLANCRDWERATLRQRFGTVREIRRVAGGPVGSSRGYGNTLDDRRAYDLLDRACAREYARGFKLYKVYTRAAAFSEQRRPPPR
jgi:hypothetical protein